MSIYQGNQKVANNYYIDNTVYCVPVGTIISYTSNIVPAGFLICDGSEVSKNTYSDLYKVVGDKFGTATDTTKFKLPDLRDKFVQGANNNVGTSKDAGLPNISGEVGYLKSANEGNYYQGINTSNGCFNQSANVITSPPAATTQFNGGTDSEGATGLIRFNASNSNSIYGNSNTVQPPAVCLTYIIKATKLSDIPIAVDGIIDDDNTSTNTTYSSNKIDNIIPTSLPANGGNADTVNNHTVLSDVPASAKFTDTITPIEDSSTTSTTSTWSAQNINDTITNSKNARVILSTGRNVEEAETKTAELVSSDGAYLYWSSQAGTNNYVFGIILYVYKWTMIPIAQSSEDASTGISFSITNNTITMTRHNTTPPTAGGVFALGPTLI